MTREEAIELGWEELSWGCWGKGRARVIWVPDRGLHGEWVGYLRGRSGPVDSISPFRVIEGIERESEELLVKESESNGLVETEI